MVNQKTSWLVLLIILLISGLLRFCHLSLLPLNWDEISHGYNAYSLLKTGRDQWGQVPVFNFRAFGDYPTTLNLYLTVLPIWIFGPTDFALRFPHALIGVITVAIAYVAAVKWQKNRLVGLIAALLVAVGPWTLFPSRAVFQSNWAVMLLFLGLAFYFSQKNIAAVLVWGLSLLAYHNTRIFIPLVLLYFLLQRTIRSEKIMLYSILSVLVLAGGILWFSPARARGNWVGILDTGAIAYLEQQRNTSKLPEMATRLLFNRPVFMFTNIIKNYLGYFSPQFLFFQGGTQYQFSVPGFGILNPILLPFFYYGIYLLWRRRQWFLLFWLVTAPLPAAITRDQYAVIRSTAMIPAVYLAISQGLASFKSKFPFWLAFWAIFCIFACSYSYTYFTSYSPKYASSWQYGNQQMVDFVKDNFSKYDVIYISKRYGEPHEFLLWYWPWNPRDFQNNPTLKWDFHDNWYWVNAFSKFQFINDWEIKDLVKTLPPGKKYLVISSPDSRPNGAKIGNINYPNGSKAYVMTVL